MALRLLSSSTIVSSPLLVANAPFRPVLALPLLRILRQPPVLRIPIPLASLAALPSLLDEIWDSVLRAVPKKKTSHMKKRHRQMAGKALKDVTELNRCSACGRVKRAHILCPYCVKSILQLWKGKHTAATASGSREASLDLAAESKRNDVEAKP